MVAGLHDITAGEAGHSARESTVDGIRIIWLGIPYSQTLGKAGRLLSFAAYAALGSAVAARVDRPDVVFATSTPLTAGIPGLITARLLGAPFVFEVRDLWPEIPIALGYLRNPIAIASAKRLERLLYGEAQALIALSPGMERGMVSMGADPRRIKIIPNMADLTLFSNPSPGLSWRSQVGIPEDAFVGVHHGTMGVVNDVGQLLDAAALLRGSGIFVALVGTGNQRVALESRARAEGLSNVIFDGPRPRSMMPWVLRGADVGLMCVRHDPVLYDNCANKFGDCLAAGLPIFVTYSGWQGKLLERYEAGLVADTAQDSESLARALLRLRDDPERARMMGVNARALARKHFAQDELVRQFEDVLVSAIEDHPRRKLPGIRMGD